jgi:octaprenyl-diphosphate synthase
VAPVGDFLERVTHRLGAEAEAFEAEIAPYARYALENQGKQLRPTLVALAAGSVGRVTDDLVTVAVIIEMVHLATLVHDDIMDQAVIRRRRPTLAAAWGTEVSVLLGDCLFAHALKLAAGFPTNVVSRAVAAAAGTVCSGEILQTHRRRRWTLARDEYFKVVEMKTAALFALACELGGQLAGATEVERGVLGRFGLALGTAYQIFDDCLDLYGAEGDAGKSLGTDLAKGKLTLPLLVFLERAGPSERARLIDRLDEWQPEYFGFVRELVEQHDGLAEAARVIEGYLDQARAALRGLRPSPVVASLHRLCGFLSQQTAGLGV